MSHAWQSYRSAPPPGTPVIEAAALRPGSSRCLSVESHKGRFPLLLVRLADGRPRAYVNACPHQYLPLDQQGPRVLSEDGRQLICSSHQARFCAESGAGLGGPGAGDGLDAVPLEVAENGWLVIGADAS
ncbi:Rieske 2Fe-2S domain-containing protein [Halomonas pacifica]|uniref:Rieske (2Fe-2S) protein n=1 Tax=Bisbaumannia pacifica TaxID=77098 RepID=UPI0023585A65|nr:Rieske 2Fe-2S domain-containing protein [Halomonas pacifica]MDC8805403.1 Rieske 2Fe-2S domain-containing protein [Halomonas pacifica]